VSWRSIGTRIRDAQHDAASDPRFARLPWEATGYSAIGAGTRYGLYYAPGIDPRVGPDDETTFATTAIPDGELPACPRRPPRPRPPASWP
jgi:hypothetical protein